MIASVEPSIKFNEPISDLTADDNGPAWIVRGHNTVTVWEPAAHGSAARASFDCPSRPKEPPVRFVAGSKEPLYIVDGFLHVGAERIDALGSHAWEHYAAVAVGDGYLIRAFAAEGRGRGFAAWTGAGAFVREPVAEGPGAGLWAPRGLSGTGAAGFVMRLVGDIGTEVETEADLRVGTWTPKATRQRAPGGQGRFYGDPAGAMDPQGRVHWVSGLWQKFEGGKYSWQLGPCYVDGRAIVSGSVDATPNGKTTARIWLPSCAWTSKGLALAWVSAMPSGGNPGDCSVGLVADGRLVDGTTRTYPGFQPHLAFGQNRIHLATSVGLWIGPELH